jgi:flagellar protein FlgJ
MLRPELSSSGGVAATIAAETQRIALPLASGTGGFGAMMSDVRREVGDFIARGSDDTPSAALRAGAEAQLARMRLGDAASTTNAGGGSLSETQQSFVDSIAPWLGEAAQQLGVAPNVLAAHAALESGWGTKPLRQTSGTDTNNLFGVKAGGSWKGDVATVTTTEFEGDVALKKQERFRAYADKGEAFRDFTQLLRNNPRFQAALNSGNDARAYAQGLARGGYATDPAYAEKLAQVAARLQSGD